MVWRAVRVPGEAHDHSYDDGDLNGSDDGGNEDIVQLLTARHHVQDVKVQELITLRTTVPCITPETDRREQRVNVLILLSMTHWGAACPAFQFVFQNFISFYLLTPNIQLLPKDLTFSRVNTQTGCVSYPLYNSWANPDFTSNTEGISVWLFLSFSSSLHCAEYMIQEATASKKHVPGILFFYSKTFLAAKPAEQMCRLIITVRKGEITVISICCT